MLGFIIIIDYVLLWIDSIIYDITMMIITMWFEWRIWINRFHQRASSTLDICHFAHVTITSRTMRNKLRKSGQIQRGANTHQLLWIQSGMLNLNKLLPSICVSSFLDICHSASASYPDGENLSKEKGSKAFIAFPLCSLSVRICHKVKILPMIIIFMKG